MIRITAIIILFFTSSFIHPLYVSLIDINQNNKDKTVEVSVRIFTEDFEATLKKNSNQSIDLTRPANKIIAEKLVREYIQKKLQLNIDGKAAELHFIGFEKQEESIWSYFEVPQIASIKKLTVNCSVLYDYQEKQMNIFHVKTNAGEQNGKLEYPKTAISFNW